MTTFTIGQRVISDGESSLGLGIIEQVSAQRIQVFYPATDEARIYAMRNAPLTRVKFNIGDSLSDVNNKQIVIKYIEEQDGILIYSDDETFIIETQISALTSLNKATDRLFAGQIDPPKWFNLRYQSLNLKAQIESSKLLGLVGSRVQPIAHQLHIAQEAADREQTRVLLADEVGLGKTIEAGLIIKRRLLSGRDKRVLLLVPANLKHQWLVEMLRKFNLEFTLFDGDHFANYANEDAEDTEAKINPFEQSQLALVAIDWLIQDVKARKALFASNWDLLVVDEAHRLQIDGKDYALVQDLSMHIENILLLTATPEQLGQASHFARLRLLDRQRFHDFTKYQQELDNYQTVADGARELLDEKTISAKSEQVINQLLNNKPLLQQALQGDADAKTRIVRELIDRHGTGRLLFRNTRHAMTGFPLRKVHAYSLVLPAQYDKQHIFPEAEYAKQNHAKYWWQFDPRVSWLADLVKELKQQKILVICAHANTVLDLEEALRTKYGVNVAVFHQGMSILERDRAAAFFAEEGGASLMICSEIGSEGRNFQFSHNLVLFDLPAVPDLLEQRIGRLDRIGQTHDIQIHVPYLDGAIEHLFNWYHEGLNAFTHTCPSSGDLYDEFGSELQQLIANFNAKKWQTFISKIAKRRKQLDQALYQGRDRLLEINSSGLGNGEQLADAIIRQDNQQFLRGYMDLSFDVFGINSEEHSANTLILSPSEHMLDAGFPLCTRAQEDATTVTYSRDVALTREDIQFITNEHPMVLGALDMVLSSSMGNCTVVMLDNKAIASGTILVELLFISEIIAPSYLGLTRFLTSAPLRCLLDGKNNDLEDKVSCDRLSAQTKVVKKSIAQQFIKGQRELLINKVKVAHDKIIPKHNARVEQARLKLSAELDEEYARLTALAKVNPNVTKRELELIEYKRDVCLKLLSEASLRLDAIRVLVAG